MRCHPKGSLFALLILISLSLLVSTCVKAENISEPALPEGESEQSIADGEAAPSVDLPILAWYEKGRALLKQLNNWRSLQGLEPLTLTLDLEDLAVQRALEWEILPSAQRPDGSTLEEMALKELHSLNCSDPELLYWRWITEYREILLDPELHSAGLAAISGAFSERPESWALVLSPEIGQAARGQRGDGAPLLIRQPLDSENYRLIVRLRGLPVSSEETLYLSPGSTSSLRSELASADSENSGGAALPPEAVEANSSDSEIVMVDREGRIQARNTGEAELILRLTAMPGMEIRLRIQVSPLKHMKLQARFPQEDNLLAWQQLQENYAALPSLQETLSDPAAARSLAGAPEDLCRIAERLQWNDKLETLALDLAQQLSLFSCEKEMAPKQGLYPTVLRPYLEERILRMGRGGWAFTRRNADDAAVPSLPGWARSAGLARLQIGQEILTVLVYSEVEGSADSFDWPAFRKSLRGDMGDPLNMDPELLRYSVSLFSIDEAFDLVFTENGAVLSSLYFTDFAQAGLEERSQGNYAYRLEPVLRYIDSDGQTIFAYPSAAALAYSIDRPEICGFAEDGALVLRGDGEASLDLRFVDVESNAILLETQLPLSIQLGFPENTESAAEPTGESASESAAAAP